MLKKVNKVIDLLEEYYIGDILIDEDEIISIIINSKDDKFLSFYLPGLFDLLILGLHIKYKEGYYTIIENKRRCFLKILEGDKLLFINNIPIASFLKESYKKEFIAIKAIRNLNDNILIIEETSKMPIVTDGSSEVIYEESYRGNDKFMYIKFTSFNEEVNKILTKCGNNNINLILDIRNNTGGNMNCMMNCLNLFLNNGDVPFSLLSKTNTLKPFITNNCSNFKFKSIFIIINEQTCSSAEIFCASLKDCLRATVMGKKSYGKNIINKNTKIDAINNVVIPTYRVLFHEQTFIDGVLPDITLEDEVEKNEILEKINLILRS